MSEQTNEETKKSPHLALVHKDQGGPANKRTASLLLKSDVELTDEAKELLKSLLGDENLQDIEKMSNNGVNQKLREAVKKFSKDRWDWAYVEDFDENVVVFSNNEGLWYTEYSLSGNEVVLGDEAKSANRIVSYEEKSGGLILSESDSISSNVQSLIVKSFDSISSNEKIKDIFKSKFTEGKQMEELQKAQELLKATQVENTELKSNLEKALAEVTEAKEALATLQKSQAEAKSAQRLELLKAVATEDQVESLHKSLEALEDGAFETVLKSLKQSKDAIEGSDLFKSVSGQGQEQEAPSALTSLTKAVSSLVAQK